MKMSKMKKNRKKLFAILLQAALVSTAMTMPAYAAKTPGIGSDARIGDDATGPVLTGGNTEMEEETSPYTKEQLEDGTLEYGEIAWRIEGYNSTYLNLRSQLYSQATSQSAGTALAAEASALMEDGLGAIVNSSRGIIAAYKKDAYAKFGPEHFADASRQAVIDMIADIGRVL